MKQIFKLERFFSNSEESKRLRGNIFFLSLLQVANYIFPLLTIPYLVRVLGPEYFGLLAFATATTMYFLLITNYGFDLSATQQISLYRGQIDKITEIYSSVMIIKVGLMVISFALMCLLIFSFEKFSQNWTVYFCTYGLVVGHTLLPVWLFQGLEKMKYITYLNVTAKAFFTACIFLFVNEKSDYLLVPILTSIGFILAGIGSLCLVSREFGIKFKWQSPALLRLQLKEGWHVFLSSFGISLYTTSATFILGLFASNVAVGHFSAADKIVQAVKGLYFPVAQAIFPLIGKKLHEDEQEGLSYLRQITLVVGIATSLMSIILFVMAEQIVSLLLGDNFEHSVVLLQIMSPLPFVIALSNILGIQTMLNLGYKVEFSRILVSAAILGIGLSLLLVPFYSTMGTAITMLLVELSVTISMFSFLKNKRKINFHS